VSFNFFILRHFYISETLVQAYFAFGFLLMTYTFYVYIYSSTILLSIIKLNDIDITINCIDLVIDLVICIYYGVCILYLVYLADVAVGKLILVLSVNARLKHIFVYYIC
jgi:hypothetical protein